MNKDLLVELVSKDHTTRSIASLLSKSQSTIRYWLTKYDLKTRITEELSNKENKVCSKCKERKDILEFYTAKDRVKGMAYCKTCCKNIVIEKQKSFKRLCIEYKGGQCKICGYNKYAGALDFHHINPTKKDFGISDGVTRAFTQQVKDELDKCILLCANCHREVHGGLINLSEIDIPSPTSSKL